MKKAPVIPISQPVTQTIAKVILEIQFLAGDLDQTNMDKLESDLWDLESKASALRSFILNHIVRKALAPPA